MIKSKKNKPINVKIFSNGAIQMTGCKTIDNALDVLIIILEEFKNIRAIVNYKEHKIVEKPYASDLNILKLKNVKKFKIAMINSNFKLPFKIDRRKLYNLMMSHGYDCVYDPNKHAPVNIKYDHIDKPISIFVFEKGPVIITGARNCGQILESYNFINKYLLTNIKGIIKNDALENSKITKIFSNK